MTKLHNRGKQSMEFLQKYKQWIDSDIITEEIREELNSIKEEK